MSESVAATLAVLLPRWENGEISDEEARELFAAAGGDIANLGQIEALLAGLENALSHQAQAGGELASLN